MSIYIYKYDEILNNSTEFQLQTIKTYVPTPTENEYKRGYIVRYFIQKRNDKNSPIYEISEDGYTTFSNNFYYNVVSLDWKIVGTDEEIKEANLKSVKFASSKLSNIHMYLPYLLQFKKQ